MSHPTDLPPVPTAIQNSSIWKHNKTNNNYRVITLGRFESDVSKFGVVYQRIDDTDKVPWIRPLDGFLQVTKAGPRFSYVGQQLLEEYIWVYTEDSESETRAFGSNIQEVAKNIAKYENIDGKHIPVDLNKLTLQKLPNKNQLNELENYLNVFREKEKHHLDKRQKINQLSVLRNNLSYYISKLEANHSHLKNSITELKEELNSIDNKIYEIQNQ